jgi:hypothetical protein
MSIFTPTAFPIGVTSGVRRDRSEFLHQALPVDGAELIQSHLPTLFPERYQQAAPFIRGRTA